jgi:glutathione S-transferase
LKAAGAALDTAYGVLDRALANRPFLAGDKFTLAEIGFAPYIEYLTLSPAAGKLTEHANVEKWWAATSARAAWQRTIGK